MSRIQIIERAQYQHMPWKNGGGITTQLMIFPNGATADNFKCRISMADVTCDGPFSEFPGVDRTLIVLDGAGINLAVASKPAERIERGSAPFSFAADAATGATLIDGPIVDLNIMTRRDDFIHRVRRYSNSATWTSACGMIVLFAQGTGLQVDCDTQTIRIMLGDTAVIFDGDAAKFEITAERAGDYYLVEFIEM